MAETLTPNYSIPRSNHKQRTPLSARLQSPTSPFFLASNDDQLERAQVRAARAAAIRRKSTVEDGGNFTRPSLACLNREQIIELFNNCLKLASENKINQKNTWELKLIDHLSEIIKVDTEGNNAETNFQKVSCTLEAGVKIYAARVDAWHSDAYRVLSRISRASLEDEQDSLSGADKASKEKYVCKLDKDPERKVSPLSTVETSFEALNVKKFDVTSAVDPLYHQTSAQFDEGGAKGLLMLNLGVFGGCRVLFDSNEVPAKCKTSLNDRNTSDLIDISFAKDCIELMMGNLLEEQVICPGLEEIRKQLDEFGSPSRMTCDLESTVNGNGSDMNRDGYIMDENIFTSGGPMRFQMNEDAFEDTEAWSADRFDGSSFSDLGLHFGGPTMEQDPYVCFEREMDDSIGIGAEHFCRTIGYNSVKNAWAGPDHWKYRKPKGPNTLSTEDDGLDRADIRPKSKKSLEADIDFIRSLDEELPQVFVCPKNPKSLLLPPTKSPYSSKLPEDCHFQPEDLVKLFLLPNVLCLGKRRYNAPASDAWERINDGPLPSWDNESTVDSHNNDCINSVVDEDVFISQPRMVNRTEVNYDKTSKQVDVEVLKETLWNCMQGSLQTTEMNLQENVISFKHVLAAFPANCKAAATRDISPHLCFICLLHLANEHGLTIDACPNMDDLTIHLPAALY